LKMRPPARGGLFVCAMCRIRAPEAVSVRRDLGGDPALRMQVCPDFLQKFGRGLARI